MSNSKSKGFLVPLIAVGALVIAGLGGGGCSSDDETTEQPGSDAGVDSSSKGGSMGKGGSSGSNNCGTADTCKSKDDCWPISCTCQNGKKIDIPATCNNGCCLELSTACKDACANQGTGGSTGQGGSNQGGSSQGGSNQGGSSQGGASQGGASGEGGAAQGGASGEGGTAQGGASGEGGTAQGGASGEGGTAQGGASGEGGTAQGGASQGGAAGTGGSGGGTITGGLVINEVDYDQNAGTPPNTTSDNQEYIELWNSGAAAIPLDGLAVILVNGKGTPATYKTVALTGTLAAGGYLLVHGPSFVPPAACAVAVAMTGCQGDTNCIQNGGNVGTTNEPDAILLVRTATNEVLDAVSYEGCAANVTVGSASLATCEGGGNGAPHDSNTEDGCISRLPNGSDTNVNATDFVYTKKLTPCAANELL